MFPVLLCPVQKASESADSLKSLDKSTLKMVAESAEASWWWRKEKVFT
jgi:hypothetical protein